MSYDDKLYTISELPEADNDFCGFLSPDGILQFIDCGIGLSAFICKKRKFRTIMIEVLLTTKLVNTSLVLVCSVLNTIINVSVKFAK